jgi:hypothetical protein
MSAVPHGEQRRVSGRLRTTGGGARRARAETLPRGSTAAEEQHLTAWFCVLETRWRTAGGVARTVGVDARPGLAQALGWEAEEATAQCV